MYYITFNDTPSGIYQSQVIDVVTYLSHLGDAEVKLIAFLPYSNFKKNKKKIKMQLPRAVVFPVFFGINRWRMLKPILKLITKKGEVAICRGPIATELALGIFRKVIYDGRAAVKAEVEEFDVTGNKQLGVDFVEAEKNAVLQSDFRIAVSNKLVDYWEKEFGYQVDKHIVIPCTLASKSSGELLMNKNDDSIKLVFSGGIGAWQSIDFVANLCRKVMKENATINVLFLTQENPIIQKLIHEFPERSERKWLKHDEVYGVLSNCDYGILIRKQNVTNKVASPVKFAEYLNAGLKVLVSENLGDFTEFVKENDCGVMVNDSIPYLYSVTKEDRNRSLGLAQRHFSKESKEVTQMYLSLLTNIR